MNSGKAKAFWGHRCNKGAEEVGKGDYKHRRSDGAPP